MHLIHGKSLFDARYFVGMQTWLFLYSTAFPVAYALLRTSRRLRRAERALLGDETSRWVRELVPIVLTPLWLPLLLVWGVIAALEALD